MHKSLVQLNPIQITVKRIIDLTHPIYEGMPYWPKGAPFHMIQRADYAREGYQFYRYEMDENTGTHIDAPAHFSLGKRSIDEIPCDQLLVPTVVMDIKEKVREDRDYRLSIFDVYAWEERYGQIPPQSLAILNTGWCKYFSEPDRYLSRDEKGIMHFPGFSRDSAELLVQREVAGIGIDTPSVDYGASVDFPVHRVMLGANRYQIENLANLDTLPATGACVFVGVLKVRNGVEAPARILALVP
ncbi:cyclase family protein [Nitrosococcus halophilus Nc 4]|uniref:Cyclase family protein n=1 Tax=Nitrosococcus halophilus (strain Nc4) TaxID=472759 RepID=D5C3M9_NITHN|nr:cyclase family protein [Nitrosococcus halophilus Nc 4]